MKLNEMRYLSVLFLAFPLQVFADEQMCQKNIASTTPTDRFAITIDVVTDSQTGLMWKKCVEGKSGSSCLGKSKSYSWQQASDYVKNLNENTGFSGYKDWRLPTVVELRSIVEEQCVNPAANMEVFPNTTPKGFWSSSPFAGFNDYVWYVNFNQGYDNYVGSNYDGNYVRLVRSVSP